MFSLDSNYMVKCQHCGKPKGDHKAATFHCPDGRRNRTHGYPYFSATKTFTPPPATTQEE